MKNNYLIFLLTLLLISCSFNSKKNDLKLMNLSGKVKEIKTNEGEETITKFNEKGYIVEKEFWEENPKKMEMKKIFNYDDKGYLTGIVYVEAEGSIYSKAVCKNDDKGNLIETFWEMHGNIPERFTKYVYKYDDNNNIVEESTYWDDNTPAYKYINKHDNKGQIIEKEITYFPTKYNEEQKVKQTINYDDKGNISEQITSNSNGQIEKVSFSYIYDSKGNWIEMNAATDKKIYNTKREIFYY